MSEDLEQSLAWVQQGKLVFGRQYSHSQGKDIVGIPSKKFASSDYWIVMIPNIIQEVRFHIVNGQSIQRQRKIFTGEGFPTSPIRNRKTGWTFTREWNLSKDLTKRLRDTAKLAVSSLGYDFGAVDLAIDKNEGIFVFEVNSAPGLDDYSCNKYTQAFIEMYKEILNNG